ncbi:hypothetical protein [Cetobacterium sp.]
MNSTLLDLKLRIDRASIALENPVSPSIQAINISSTSLDFTEPKL